ncbi:MAG: glycosyltransferase [Caldilineaceae bacterium]
MTAYSIPQAPRVAIYSQDGLGLGHMRRTSAIATQFLRLRPDASILTLSDSQLGQFFPMAPNHDYLKLPSIVKRGPGDWHAARLALPFAEVHKLRRQLIKQALLTFAPHLFLVDHMPHGTMGELLPALSALKSSGARTKVVLGLRDILDAPQVVQERWQVEGAAQAVEKYYDLVLIYGMREVFDLAHHYKFSPQIAARLRYCGYVCPPINERRLDAIPNNWLATQSAGAKSIVAMAGGGADAYPMMRALVDALPIVEQQHRCTLLLITGPFMPVAEQNDLLQRAQGRPIQVISAVEDTYSYLQAADLVVAMAGYNTTVETLQSGKRAIMIPRRGPSAEQRLRTQLFAAQGWLEMLDPDELSGPALAQLILNNLDQSTVTPPALVPDLQGVEKSAEQLLALLRTPTAVNGSRPNPETVLTI